MPIFLVVAVILIVGSLWLLWSGRKETESLTDLRIGEGTNASHDYAEKAAHARNRTLFPDLVQELKNHHVAVVITLLLLSYLFSAAGNIFHELAEKEKAASNPNAYYLEEKARIERPLLLKLAKGTIELERYSAKKDVREVIEMVRAIQNDVAEARKAIEGLETPPDCQELKELTSIFLLITQASYDAMLNKNQEQEKHLRQQLNIFKEKLAKEEKRIRDLSGEME